MSAEEVLGKHVPAGDGSCRCDSREVFCARHQLDALKAAGYEVVALAKPNDLDTINRDLDRHVAGWDVDAGDGRIEVRVDIFRRIHVEGVEYTASEVKALVPVLMSAIDEAEES